jgi:AraC-like DNA-binding protein
LAAHGIDAVTSSNGDAFISLRLVERVLDDAARQFEAPDFGLLHILGPLAIAMENSPTVGDALECANRYLFVLSPAFTHAVIPDPLGAPGVLGIRFANSLANRWPQGIDYGVGIVHRVVALLSGGVPYGLRTVQLPHARLAPEDVYRDYFGAEVAFDCPEAVLRVPRQVMDVPITGANDLLRDIAVDFLESHFSHQSVPVSELVVVILGTQLGPDGPDLAKVARFLDLHPRSLQRLLSREGVGFKDLVDRVRRQQALELISTTELSFSRIADRVGLREQSSLTRAVRRWFGVSPSELRSTTSTLEHESHPPP